MICRVCVCVSRQCLFPWKYYNTGVCVGYKRATRADPVGTVVVAASSSFLSNSGVFFPVLPRFINCCMEILSARKSMMEMVQVCCQLCKYLVCFAFTVLHFTLISRKLNVGVATFSPRWKKQLVRIQEDYWGVEGKYVMEQTMLLKKRLSCWWITELMSQIRILFRIILWRSH